jgi:hypothetical protein
MDDIEKRIKALEKRSRDDIERWQALEGDLKAFSAALTCIVRPIGVTNPKIIRTVIKNLKTYETVSRMDNQHSQMIVRLRRIREVFESQLKEIETNGSSSEDLDKPPRKK